MDQPIYYQSISKISAALQNRSLTSLELMDIFVARTEDTEKKLHSFISYDVDDARNQAASSQRRWNQGEPFSPFDGIPIAIKDLISVKGQPLTCGSRMLGSYVRPYDATVISKLRAA